MKIVIIGLILLSFAGFLIGYQLGCEGLEEQQKVLERMLDILKLHSDHILNFEHTDSLLMVNVNRIYKLLDVEWEIRLKPDSTDTLSFPVKEKAWR